MERLGRRLSGPSGVDIKSDQGVQQLGAIPAKKADLLAGDAVGGGLGPDGIGSGCELLGSDGKGVKSKPKA